MEIYSLFTFELPSYLLTIFPGYRRDPTLTSKFLLSKSLELNEKVELVFKQTSLSSLQCSLLHQVFDDEELEFRSLFNTPKERPMITFLAAKALVDAMTVTTIFSPKKSVSPVNIHAEVEKLVANAITRGLRPRHIRLPALHPSDKDYWALQVVKNQVFERLLPLDRSYEPPVRREFLILSDPTEGRNERIELPWV